MGRGSTRGALCPHWCRREALGKIDIGDHCRIGANAVVLTSVPPGRVAVGIPAVIKARTVQGRGLALEEPH